MAKIQNLVRAFKHLFAYGYAVSFFSALQLGEAFVAITRQAVYSTYDSVAGDCLDDIRKAMEEKGFKYIGFYYGMKVSQDKVRPLLLSSEVKNNRLVDGFEASVSLSVFERGSKGEAKYIKSLNKGGTFVVPVEDTILTALPIELIISAMKVSNGVRI